MKIEIINVNEDQPLPEYITDGSAAVDLFTSQIINPFNDEVASKYGLHPGETCLVKTGIRINIKKRNVAALILARSGLSCKLGITLVNGVGLIDPDYQGEILLKIKNKGQNTFYIKEGMRLAQMMFIPIIRAEFVAVSEFSTTTKRGENGIGHTGVY